MQTEPMDQLNAALLVGFVIGVIGSLSVLRLMALRRPSKSALDIEDALERSFWGFDEQRRTLGERDAFKGQVRHLLQAMMLAALVLGLAACTPAQTAAAGRGFATAAKVVLDLAKCEMAGGGSPLMKTVASELAASPEARERYRTALVAGQALKIGGVYIGAQDAACLLSMVASVIPQSGAPHNEGLGAVIVRRAEVCDTDGGCDRPEDRAAQLLRDLWRAGVVVLPPSGQG